MNNLLRGVSDFIPQNDDSTLPDRKLRVKVGFDPTTSHLHLGHLVLLKKARDFQRQGHQIVLLLGTFTACIGDPTGKNQTRPQLTRDEVISNANKFLDQVFKVLDRDKTEVVFNHEWWDTKSPVDMINLMSSVTVSRMLDREDFSNRFKSCQPISMHEFLYPLLQGHDSIEVNADIELGGTDQLFNMHMGRNLQQRIGKNRQGIITMPILLGTDGTHKMSKSLGNTINFDDTAYLIRQKILNMPDSNIQSYIDLLTDDVANGQSPIALKQLVIRSVLQLLQKEDEHVTIDVDKSINIVSLLNKLNIVKNVATGRDLVSRKVVLVDGVVVDCNTRVEANTTISIKPGKRDVLKVTVRQL